MWATQTFFLFLKHTKLLLASGFLHLLFLVPVTLVLQICRWLAPFHSDLSSNITSLNGFLGTPQDAHPHSSHSDFTQPWFTTIRAYLKSSFLFLVLFIVYLHLPRRITSLRTGSPECTVHGCSPALEQHRGCFAKKYCKRQYKRITETMKAKAYRIQTSEQEFAVLAVKVSKMYSQFGFYLTGTRNRAWAGTTLKGELPLSSNLLISLMSESEKRHLRSLSFHLSASVSL